MVTVLIRQRFAHCQQCYDLLQQFDLQATLDGSFVVLFETGRVLDLSLIHILEHLVEIINQIVSKDNIYLGEIQKKENELKENISCLSHDLRTPLTLSLIHISAFG